MRLKFSFNWVDHDHDFLTKTIWKFECVLSEIEKRLWKFSSEKRFNVLFFKNKFYRQYLKSDYDIKTEDEQFQLIHQMGCC